MRVNEYLKNNKIYNENTDKLPELDPRFVQDDSWNFLFLESNIQKKSFLRKRRNSVKNCQGQDGKSLIETEESARESETETIQTESKKKGNTSVPVCAKELELKEDSFSKAKGERGIRLTKINKEDNLDIKNEESKKPSDIKTLMKSENSLPEDTSSEQAVVSENTNSDTFIVLPSLPSDEGKRLKKSEDGDSKICKSENFGKPSDSENNFQKINEEYEPEEIKELVLDIKQRVIEQRKHGLPERFMSL